MATRTRPRAHSSPAAATRRVSPRWNVSISCDSEEDPWRSSKVRRARRSAQFEALHHSLQNQKSASNAAVRELIAARGAQSSRVPQNPLGTPPLPVADRYAFGCKTVPGPAPIYRAGHKLHKNRHLLIIGDFHRSLVGAGTGVQSSSSLNLHLTNTENDHGDFKDLPALSTVERAGVERGYRRNHGLALTSRKSSRRRHKGRQERLRHQHECCHGHVEADANPMAWIYLPKGTCRKRSRARTSSK